MNGYENHPASTLFPMMTDEEMGDLVENIKQHGLLEPLVLCEGMVLDGRNRLAACKRNGVAPRFIKWNGEHGSPTQYVLAKNLHRRHLTTSQRAVIAAESVPLLQEEAKKRKARGRPRLDKYLPVESREVPPEHTFADDPGAARWEEPKGDSCDIAAKAVGVGGSIVQKALTVKQADPKEAERIKRGETTVEAAYRKVRTGKPSKRQEQREKAGVQRMGEWLSEIRGLCHSLGKLDPKVLISGCTAKDTKHWSNQAFFLARQLRQFGSKIKSKKE